MSILLKIVLFTCFLLCDLNFASAQSGLPASVKKIIDGDSILVISKGKSIQVRLYGIDCPEYSQKHSSQAKYFTKQTVLNKNIILYPEYNDVYGRLVATVEYEGYVLNQELVREGLAWVYPRYCKKSICKEWYNNQKMAKKYSKGLWVEPNPVPPWKWKRIHRN